MSREPADREAYWRENTRLDAQNAELRAEIERLRAVLHEIAAYPHSEEGGELARAALEPKP